jgi:uncharacterized protein YggU (UPF0235/DUF167 family)
MDHTPEIQSSTLRACPEGTLVSVRVRPRSRPGVRLEGGTLVIAVASPPVEGRATEEARRALAVLAGVSPRRVRLRSGERSRAKTFLVLALEPRDLVLRLPR